MTRINFTINSRVYTVVADENEEYIRRLCEYVNEKVNIVLHEGNHVMGEKPLVLAALNICDEYFKLLDAGASAEKLTDIIAENNQLKEELKDVAAAGSAVSERAAELKDELEITKKILDETEEQIKFLEGQIKLKEAQIKKQRSEFALREKELLDMLESK